MQVAAVHALAKLARQSATEQVAQAYAGQDFRFGREYLIPKPFDSRVLLWVAPAVAKAAMDTGVARAPIAGHGRLPRSGLSKLIDPSWERAGAHLSKGAEGPKRLVFPRAAPAHHEGRRDLRRRAHRQAILLGDRERIKKVAAEHQIDLTGI